jgi:ABC-type uncharacterized transport system ATPase subunit
MKDCLPASCPAIAFANKPIGAAAGEHQRQLDGFRALTDLSLAIGVGELRCDRPQRRGQDHLMDVITGKTRRKAAKRSTSRWI